MSEVLHLRERLDELFADSYDLDVGADRTVILTAIGDAFKGKTRKERLALIEPLLSAASLSPGILDLYDPDEARELGVEVATGEVNPPSNWDDAVAMLESGRVVNKYSKNNKKLHKIVFYSYKGGVGRTTALVHTAFHLARGGTRVAIADMDVEAPGLHLLLPRPDGSEISVGLIDYLWERQVRPFDPKTEDGLETCLVNIHPNKKAISYVVEDPISRAQINVIPAGAVGANYVRRLHTLSYQDVLTKEDDAWSLFEKELVEQLAPDVLLIDARTGLGDWGGLSLLRLADEAFLVIYPSEQNLEGFRFVRKTISEVVGLNSHIVLSPVPEGAIGKAVVGRIIPLLGLEHEEQVIEVGYNPAVASASVYPVETAMANYAMLAGLIKEGEVEENLEGAISKYDRWGVIESLKFPDRDAKTITADDFDAFFQKTSDFDKFLDDARWVVRGRKGTGKSTLFHLFVEHQENAVKRAQGKMQNVIILPGHGPVSGAEFRPTTDEFGTIQRSLESSNSDWLSLWRAYAIVRIYTSSNRNLMDDALKNPYMKGLKLHLSKSFTCPPPDRWRSEHTNSLLAMVSDPFNGMCRDLFGDINSKLEEKGEKLWLLYDDLDQDIKEDSSWQGDALGGLLRLAYDSNNQDLFGIRFKIFLREDIWGKLVFTNKSHFGEPRTLLLQWKIEDFLRLAYRLSTGGSKLFSALAQRHYPMSDAEVDNASEEQLRRALAPLWGLNPEKSKNSFSARWVYNRMTDSRDNTYPRSLTVLLNSAREVELEAKNGSKAVPSNRLLSHRAMIAGLERASEERVNALKNEYPSLDGFLLDVQEKHSLKSQFSSEELEKVWDRTSTGQYATFESFVAHLENSGLLMRKSGKGYDYGFAQLYIDGLGVTRVQGEKK
jgi:MinD-like ATPase involved in chromosome partitioning or flagellar assembly